MKQPNNYLGWNAVCLKDGHSWCQDKKRPSILKCSMCNKEMEEAATYEDWGF